MHLLIGFHWHVTIADGIVTYDLENIFKETYFYLNAIER